MRHVIAPLLLLWMTEMIFGRPRPTRQLSPRVVDTVDGPVRATVVSRPGLRPVEAFLGVRYATARRFERPTTAAGRRWRSVKVASDFGPVCPQRIPDMDRTDPRGAGHRVSVHSNSQLLELSRGSLGSRWNFLREFQTWIS